MEKHKHHHPTHSEEAKGGEHSHMHPDHHHKAIKQHMAALHKMAKDGHKHHHAKAAPKAHHKPAAHHKHK